MLSGRYGFLVLCLLTISVTVWAGPPVQDEPPEEDVAVYEFSDSFAAPGALSATPGGAQDINFVRDRVSDGGVPHPNVFTAEGLFSEHDLPLASTTRCRQLLCARGEAVATRLIAQPEVQYLGQLGFSTNLNPAKFQRAPLNLVAVVDKSGSMSGELPLVQDSLLEVLGQLGPRDQMSIVLYGDVAHTLLSPTSAGGPGKRAIRAAIGRIQSSGSTAMENGLRVGFGVARASAPSFPGTTRVMLFTDERPNVGATDAGSFMGMARAASADGIGMTTVGVGVQFGAELATMISSVRGGNLFFFPDSQTMAKVFESDFDTMVTELAHDLRLVVEPGRGLKLVGIYGIPGDMLRWGRNGSLEVEIETAFLSRRSGAIYVAVAPVSKVGLPKRRLAPGTRIASIDMAYTPVGGVRQATSVDLTTVHPAKTSVGLARGMLLVDQVTALKEATRLHHEANDQEGAYQLVHALATRLRGEGDATMNGERTLVFALEQTLAKLSGHEGEPSSTLSGRHAVSGLPLRQRREARTSERRRRRRWGADRSADPKVRR